MDCIYCRGGRNLLDRLDQMSLKGDFYPGIEVRVDGDELTVIAVADTYEPNFMEEYIKIKYCPMCGRNLL